MWANVALCWAVHIVEGIKRSRCCEEVRSSIAKAEDEKSNRLVRSGK